MCPHRFNLCRTGIWRKKEPAWISAEANLLVSSAGHLVSRLRVPLKLVLPRWSDELPEWLPPLNVVYGLNYVSRLILCSYSGGSNEQFYHWNLQLTNREGNFCRWASEKERQKVKIKYDIIVNFVNNVGEHWTSSADDCSRPLTFIGLRVLMNHQVTKFGSMNGCGLIVLQHSKKCAACNHFLSRDKHHRNSVVSFCLKF